MSSRDEIISVIKQSIHVKESILTNEEVLTKIQDLANLCLHALISGGKIIFAGNGGSFADSQHLAAEFVSRLQFDRDPLASVALGTNSSSTTAIGNDYGYEQIFVRELKAIGHDSDVFIPISTSGNSKNLVIAVEYARVRKIRTIALTGQSGGILASMVDCIMVPSTRTERIQEAHIMIGHIVCGLVENEFFRGKH